MAKRNSRSTKLSKISNNHQSKDKLTSSREKYNKNKPVPRKPTRGDLRERLRRNHIQSQVNNSTKGVSPKARGVLKISKTLKIPQKKFKKRVKGLHMQSISFSRKGAPVTKEIDKRINLNRNSIDSVNNGQSKSPFCSKITRGERYIDQRIRNHLKNSGHSREKFRLPK